ncbi:CLUMA_CG004340, isoform A [Clunio marinus]|uniref:tRNA (guanine(9)-N(1))-methyltransferase n=1 Tax=Clunio marinus TaxID=568069 RepID=A0A1J1HVV1_9DIPT|nr:CLUMA_CG004340, isoform A [Clunio marinus]
MRTANTQSLHTSNKKAMRPFPLHFTGLKKGSEMFAAMNRHNGRQNWGIWHEESYLDFFDKTKLIYLTSESENVLDTLEPGAVYVIGGLVDFNRHKNLCNRIALENGIRTARLPLSENVVMKNSPVLPIDQCFDIILGVSQGKTWQKSIMDVLSYRRLLAPTNNVQTPESSKNEQSGIVSGPIKMESDMEKAYENEQSGIVDDPIKSKSDMEYASDKLRFEEARKKLNQAVKMDSSEMFN